MADVKKKAAPRPEDPDEQLAKDLRKTGTPWLRAGLLHASLAIALIGGPLVRGMLRAEASAEAYARFVGCMLGGTPAESPGLALPDGDRAAFALALRTEEAEWPARCEADLDAVGIEDAVLVMPNVRERETTVRAAVTMMREELRRTDRTPGAAIPVRPLEVLGRLQAALTELVDEAHARLEPRALAISLPDQSLTTASRIPLSVAEGGLTDVRWTDAGLDFVASDARRVSVVRVRGGTVHEEHERRSNGARGITVGPDAATHLLFSTRPEVCEDEEDHCEHRMTGVAATDGSAVREREAERWLGGHVVGRTDRSAWVEGTRAGLLVRSGEGIAAAVFDWSAPPAEALPAPVGIEAPAEGGAAGPAEGPDDAALPAVPPGDEVAADVPRVSAAFRLELGLPRDALLLRDRVLWLGAGALHVARIAGAAFAPTLERPIASSRLWGCGDFVVVGRDEGVEVFFASETLGPIAAVPSPLRGPLSSSHPEAEPIQLACDGELLVMAMVRDERTLDVVACDATSCRVLVRGTHEVAGAAVAVGTSEVFVAEWGSAGADQVVVMRAVRAPVGALSLEPDVPLPPCWSDGRGFCGPASFVSDPPRLALVVRENADALVLALEDEVFAGLPRLR